MRHRRCPSSPSGPCCVAPGVDTPLGRGARGAYAVERELAPGQVNVRPLILFFLVTLAWGVGCAGSEPDRASPGRWGGDHVRLDVSEAGAAVEFDCAHGTVDQPMALDAEGRFDARGTYVREHGGPVRPDETENSEPARYTGSVVGRSMSLTVVLDDGTRLGPFALTLGDEGRLLKCL